MKEEKSYLEELRDRFENLSILSGKSIFDEEETKEVEKEVEEGKD